MDKFKIKVMLCQQLIGFMLEYLRSEYRFSVGFPISGQNTTSIVDYYSLLKSTIEYMSKDKE